MTLDKADGCAIVALRVHRRSIALVAPFVTAVRRATHADIVVVEAVDADGRSGWGEAAISWLVTGESPDSVAAAVAGPLLEAVRGRSAADPGIPASVAACVWGNAAARSAVECAVFDLSATQRGRSVHRDLGASTRVVRTDMTLSADAPEALAAASVAHVAAGFRTLKVKARADGETVAGLRAIRHAVGNRIGLRVDANQAWTPDEAIDVIRECEREGLELEFVEQPVAAGDLNGMARVARSVGVPVMADESVRTVADVREIARLGAAAMVNIKLAKTGGLAEAQRVADAAQAAGLQVVVGCMLEGDVGIAAAASLAAAIAPATVHDLDASRWLQGAAVNSAIDYDRDLIRLGDGPGLGVMGLSDAGERQSAEAGSS